MALPGDAIIEVVFRGILFGQTTMSVMHYRVAAQAPAGVSVQAEMAQLADIFNDDTVGELKGLYRAVCPNAYTMTQVSVQPVYPLRYRKTVRATNSAGIGGDSTTANVQAAITLTTDFAGRNQIGGIHPPCPTSMASGGILDGDYVNALGDLGQSLITPVSNVGLESSYQLVIWHRGIQPPLSYTGVTGYIPQTEARVMRRRTVGLGI